MKTGIMENTLQEIIYALESFRDEKRREMSKNYYPTSMQVIGVVVPNIKKVIKELKRKPGILLLHRNLSWHSCWLKPTFLSVSR